MRLRSPALAVALLVLVSASACEDPEVPTGPTPLIPPHLPGSDLEPAPAGPVLAIVRPGSSDLFEDGAVVTRFRFETSGPRSQSREFNPRRYFRHRDDAPGRTVSLDYEVESEGRGVVLAVLVDWSVLLEPLAVGEELVRVTATDPDGNRAGFAVAVEVAPRNHPPQLAVPLPSDIVLDEHEQRVGLLSLEDHFVDPDGDPLEFEAWSSDSTVVRAYVSGSRLTLVAVHAGDTAVGVEARDPVGERATHRIRVVVRPTGH